MIRERVRVYSGGGSPLKEKFRARYDDLGRVELVSDGVDDLYAYIQSHRDSVDIHVLVDRFARGDVAALSQRQGVYADVTGVPRTYADLLNIVNDLEYRFSALPADVRDKFGNSFARYAASLGTDEYLSALGIGTVDQPVVHNDKVGDSSES